MSADRWYCIEEGCSRPTKGYGDRCPTHTKQFQRHGKCYPITEELTPRARFLEAILRVAEADDSNDSEFNVAFRTAWNIPAREAIKKLKLSDVRALLKKLRSRAARRALKAAQARGVRIGAPRRVDRAKVIRMLRRGDSPEKIAKLLGVTDRTVRRLRTQG